MREELKNRIKEIKEQIKLLEMERPIINNEYIKELQEKLKRLEQFWNDMDY